MTVALLVLVASVSASLLRSSTSTCGSRGVFADGFSRTTCADDVSPKGVRTYYADNVRKMYQRKMTPDVCFQFCRSVENAKFFGISHGKDCYCTKYFHAQSTSGGECDNICEGDNKQKCGGLEKSSLFEMHMCAEGNSRAEGALTAAEDGLTEASDAAGQAKAFGQALADLSKRWEMTPACSLYPAVCDLAGHFQKQGFAVNALGRESEGARDDLRMAKLDLETAKTNFEEAGDDATQVEYDELEKNTTNLRKQTINAKAKATGTLQGLKRMAGGIAKKTALADFTNFYTALPQEDDHHAFCMLDRTESFEVANVTDPAVCADYCQGQVSTCVGFNYQAVDGAFACEFLKGTGTVKKELSMSNWIPVIVVTESKVQDLGLAGMGCYVKATFLNGKKVSVEKKIIKQ
mmetsp:Transcript_17532/g.40288  ORF Transcript_17532/g.40288 Transcript_17532/m.40288 type:complete len:406 (+) Transcript_17532:104-1321(+)